MLFKAYIPYNSADNTDNYSDLIGKIEGISYE